MFILTMSSQDFLHEFEMWKIYCGSQLYVNIPYINIFFFKGPVPVFTLNCDFKRSQNRLNNFELFFGSHTI